MSNLSSEDYAILARRFPNDVELTLGMHLPSKVNADFYEVIPVGKPVFLWFTYLYDKHIAVLVSQNTRHTTAPRSHNHPQESTSNMNSNDLYRFNVVSTCFADELAYGTIMTGVLFSRQEAGKEEFHKFMNVSDILYYKGARISGKQHTMYYKLRLIASMFENNEIANLNGSSNVLNISMPIITNDYTIAQGYLGSLPYSTYGIRLINLDKTKSIGILPNLLKKGHDHKYVFVVKASVEPDTYSLFANDNSRNAYAYATETETANYNGNSGHANETYESCQYGKLRKINVALIPSYNDSVRMNMLFRNIKENISIDAIEESDDEDDFQNVDPNKYLLPDIEYKMYCYFSRTHNKWIPETIASDEVVVTDFNDAKMSLIKNMTTNKNKFEKSKFSANAKFRNRNIPNYKSKAQQVAHNSPTQGGRPVRHHQHQQHQHQQTRPTTHHNQSQNKPQQKATIQDKQQQRFARKYMRNKGY